VGVGQLAALLDECVADRDYSYRATRLGFVKRHGLDLAFKFTFLMANSVGRPEAASGQLLLLDETKASHVQRSLAQLSALLDAGLRPRFVRLSGIGRKGHARLGLVWPLAMTIKLWACIVAAQLTRFPRHERSDRASMRVVLRLYGDALARLGRTCRGCLMMSDYTFFGTATARLLDRPTFVAQHGLVLDDRLYYPPKADHFLAWGRGSLARMRHDPRVVVAGKPLDERLTDGPVAAALGRPTLLYCVSSLEPTVVKRKLDVLLSLCDELNLSLAVKWHPGSLSNMADLAEALPDRVQSYKDENLSELVFDYGVLENSTVVLDFVAMRKKFVIFDESGPCFEPYRDVLPMAATAAGLRDAVAALPTRDFEATFDRLLHDELNDGQCSVGEVIRQAVSGPSSAADAAA
jgi:hypothetical protein